MENMEVRERAKEVEVDTKKGANAVRMKAREARGGPRRSRREQVGKGGSQGGQGWGQGGQSEDLRGQKGG